MSLFVDTSIWYAVADSSDADNARAKQVLSGGEPLVTTDHVLVETWALTRRRVRRRAAEKFWEGLREGGAWIEPVGVADLDTASRIGADFREQVSRLSTERVSPSCSGWASSALLPLTTILPSLVWAPTARCAFTIVR